MRTAHEQISKLRPLNFGFLPRRPSCNSIKVPFVRFNPFQKLEGVGLTEKARAGTKSELRACSLVEGITVELEVRRPVKFCLYFCLFREVQNPRQWTANKNLNFASGVMDSGVSVGGRLGHWRFGFGRSGLGRFGLGRFGISGVPVFRAFWPGTFLTMQGNNKIPSWNEIYSREPLLHIFFRVARDGKTLYFNFLDTSIRVFGCL